ncbi:MAG: radical SAM protein [Myxococcota bacterium]|nr:radical SAM protein [Myxococcota bacterium]
MLRPVVLEVRGRPDLAEVFVARLRPDAGSPVEFVDAIDPRRPREEKWVVTVSTQFGCPIRCAMCDSGGHYAGNLTADEILAQIDYVVRRRAPDGRIPCPKFKIHFARMGEPALNPAVIDVLERLPDLYDAPGLMACIPTVAPRAANDWFNGLLDVKRRLYRGRFQLQFSINSTDPAIRDRLMPVAKWDLDEIAAYGRRFFEPGDRRVVLNFALARGVPVDPGAVAAAFDPERFVAKLTPVNPTEAAAASGLETVLSAAAPDAADRLVERFAALGFDAVVSIGEAEEIAIGSNCGQAVAGLRRARAVEQAAASA